MADLVNRIFDKTMPGLERALDLTWQRNSAISSNIANAETPAYRAVDLDFAGELKRAFQKMDGSVKQTDPRHLDLQNNSGSQLVPDHSGMTKADGNNVDIDLQMGRLAYNSGQFANVTGLIRKKMGMLRNMIREAGGR